MPAETTRQMRCGRRVARRENNTSGPMRQDRQERTMTARKRMREDTVLAAGSGGDQLTAFSSGRSGSGAMAQPRNAKVGPQHPAGYAWLKALCSAFKRCVNRLTSVRRGQHHLQEPRNLRTWKLRITNKFYHHRLNGKGNKRTWIPLSFLIPNEGRCHCRRALCEAINISQD